MARCSHTINAPIDITFAVLSDIPRIEQNISAIDAVEIVKMPADGTVGAGTRWRETRTMFGKAHTEEMEITEFDAPRRYLVEAIGNGAHYRTEFTFEEVPGGTRVTVDFSARALSLFAKLMVPLTKLMEGSLNKMLIADMKDAGAIAEARAGTDR